MYALSHVYVSLRIDTLTHKSQQCNRLRDSVNLKSSGNNKRSENIRMKMGEIINKI